MEDIEPFLKSCSQHGEVVRRRLRIHLTVHTEPVRSGAVVSNLNVMAERREPDRCGR